MLNLAELDGYFTALVSSPAQVDVAEWFPAIWGGQNPEWESMDEAQRFDWLIAMDAGQILAEGRPADLLQRTGAATLEAAFIALLPEARRQGYQAIEIPPLQPDQDLAIEADGKPLSVRDKGPIWLLYPFDSDAQYQTEVIYARSIWQIERMEVLE